MSFGPICFEEALPRLVATYNKGKLVPFTSSGISAPAIPSWRQFIKNLSGFTDIPFDDSKKYTSQELITFAEKLVSQLKDESEAKFVQAVKKSLGYKAIKPAVTLQCKSLCKIWWPLIVTTNYDSMLVDEYMQRHSTPNEVPISVYGRKSVDCHSLLSLLNSPSGTSYWALQGYFGNNRNGENLEPEIVVGYKQYRKVTYNNPIFRAAFGEVFRNHSLFFIGSGLSEDYFMGLFGEVLERYGGNPHAHLALFNKKDIDNGSIDPQFLHTKLNTVAIYYEDKAERYDGLAPCLDQLAEAVVEQSQKLWKFSFAPKTLLKLSNEKIPALELCVGLMPPLQHDQCNICSAGFSDKVLLSTIGKGIILKHDKEYDEKKFQHTNRKLIWKYGEYPFYAAIARNIQDGVTSHDSRDLRKVSEAMFDALAETNGKFEVINIMLLAAGKKRVFPPLYSLIQMIRGYKAYIESNFMKSSVKIHIVDPSVSYYIRVNPLEIEEILNCKDFKLNIIKQSSEELDRFQLFVTGNKTLKDISEFYGIKSKNWDVKVFPRPFLDQKINVDDNISLEEVGLIPNSTILYVK